jgi:hypothetical protein
VVGRQPGQIVQKTLSQKKNSSHKRAGEVALGKGPEFKPQYFKKRERTVLDICHILTLG